MSELQALLPLVKDNLIGDTAGVPSVIRLNRERSGGMSLIRIASSRIMPIH
jgi:hypothetical protein